GGGGRLRGLTGAEQRNGAADRPTESTGIRLPGVDRRRRRPDPPVPLERRRRGRGEQRPVEPPAETGGAAGSAEPAQGGQGLPGRGAERHGDGPAAGAAAGAAAGRGPGRDPGGDEGPVEKRGTAARAGVGGARHRPRTRERGGPPGPEPRAEKGPRPR